MKDGIGMQIASIEAIVRHAYPEALVKMGAAVRKSDAVFIIQNLKAAVLTLQSIRSENQNG